MKKTIWLFVVFLLAFPFGAMAATSLKGIPGATDRVRAATLIVPFFEAGIDSTQHGDDTFVMVTNTNTSAVKLHWHVWDIDGNALDFSGNKDIVGLGMWVTTLRALINTTPASAAAKTAMTQGDFYQGFMTIDLVTADTTFDPTNAAYPFDNNNYLEGYIYYVNLAKGMSNGITMIPLEYVATPVDPALTDFYANSDGREQIDSEARDCASETLDGDPCTSDDYMSRVDSRVYLTPPNGSSRIIVFSWAPGLTVGPSTWCAANGCDPDLDYFQYNQVGTLLSPVGATLRLDHAVNVIDVTGTENGWFSIRDIPSGIADFQIFPAFLFFFFD